MHLTRRVGVGILASSAIAGFLHTTQLAATSLLVLLRQTHGQHLLLVQLQIVLFVCAAMCICMLCLQIQTCKQHATAIVHSYPQIPEKGQIIEALASQRGEPPKEVLMQAAGMDSFQHAANWQQVVEYLQDVNAGNLNQHVVLMIQDDMPNVANSQLEDF